jgi:hypothetical protein
MDDLRTRALLVDFDSVRTGAGAIGTTITRAEVAETAAGGEFPATMLLDLDRVETDGGAGTATVALEWDEESLGQLLATTEEPEIALWFDEAGLAHAFEEVEAHGLREKAAVIAVAAAAAGVAAPTALASHAGGGDLSAGGGAAAHSAAVVQPMGAERGVLQDEQIAPSTGQAVTSSGVTARPATVDPGSSGPLGAERAMLQDENLNVAETQGTPEARVSPSSGGTGGLSSGEVAGIAGAAGALLISAAGFGVARKRQPPVQPA